MSKGGNNEPTNQRPEILVRTGSRDLAGFKKLIKIKRLKKLQSTKTSVILCILIPAFCFNYLDVTQKYH